MTDSSRPIAPALRPLRDVVRSARRARALVALPRGSAIAPGVAIGARARWLSHGLVSIGPDVRIGTDFFVEADLEIGPHVLISSRVAIIHDDHPFDASDVPITQHPRRPMGRVVIEGDNLIGHGTIIIGPSVIGRGAIVGAGSLVVGDVPGDTVCVGRPARPIRRRRPSDVSC